MLVYSLKIVRFIAEIKHCIKEVLSREIGLKVGKGRFYDFKQRASYPIRIVIFNNAKMLGYFDPNFYELGFHECLMQCSKGQLGQVIRHELAHYMTFIQHGDRAQPHGSEFKSFCQEMGWGQEISRATACLEGGLEACTQEESSVLRKVQKLMALSTSNNKNEAEAAMIKSQQLLLKHNLESPDFDSGDEEKMFLKRIMQQKKISAKMRCIAQILETFFVTIVYSRSRDFICLEILGNAVNVEIAEYVANVLDADLEELWKWAQQNSSLKGTLAKNSFFLGLAKGYCNKIQALKREHHKEITKALMVIEKKLLDAKKMAYPHLCSTKSQGGYCKESSALGERMGKELTINPALKNAAKNLMKLLS
ncbi:MAG: DUF2786 domain-containing protein [Rhabdochlamydiaceae bacterium]|nr:DUF2786 domain-containing protein [Rhabdochlamydiaceae bacterium]